ncbi:hypothetical protein [Dechloromonas denitrificans]|uniref:hypothetical protein n=1 Tax=Dechloromonas denitrificans TaxID=281362 RepID=UPI001CFB964F|nr:hypothetical protein [Dechloromonas denitrificans]UCV09146.1 hypothetical protein KI615_06355 [Dechloromonas denitrificans]
MENQSITSEYLPKWIPWQGHFVLETITSNGGFSTPRLAEATQILFSAGSLEPIWRVLSQLSLGLDGWGYLIRSIINSLDCAPERGKRATRDAPDEKIRVLEQQKHADKLLKKTASTARELAKLLYELEENGGQVPGETYSGLALIQSAIESNGMSRACCKKPFETFKRQLSSYARGYFPPPILILETLAESAEQQPECSNFYADDPWLSSSQSSWKDYVRVLSDCFHECKRMYGTAPNFSDANWTALVQVLIDKSITRQAVAKGLKEL